MNRQQRGLVEHFSALEVASVLKEHAQEIADFEKQVAAMSADGNGFRNLAIAFANSFRECHEGDLLNCAKYCAAAFKAKNLAAQHGETVSFAELGFE